MGFHGGAGFDLIFSIITEPILTYWFCIYINSPRLNKKSPKLLRLYSALLSISAISIVFGYIKVSQKKPRAPDYKQDCYRQGDNLYI